MAGAGKAELIDRVMANYYVWRRCWKQHPQSSWMPESQRYQHTAERVVVIF
jgi:hypothetical protein